VVVGRHDEPVVSVVDNAAKMLHLKPGSILEFHPPVATFDARVAAVHSPGVVRNRPTTEMCSTGRHWPGCRLIFVGGCE
jgi:hypothetical protein